MLTRMHQATWPVQGCLQCRSMIPLTLPPPPPSLTDTRMRCEGVSART